MEVIKWCLTLILLCAIPFLNTKNKLYITSIAIFFPVYLTGFGHPNIISSGTLCIFTTFITSFPAFLSQFKTRSKAINLFLWLLIFLGLIATLMMVDQVPKPLRLLKSYVYASGALLCFFMFYNVKFGSDHDILAFFHSMLKIIIICTAIHVIISVIIFYNTELERYLLIFRAVLNEPSIIEVSSDTLTPRIRDFVFETESFGEFLAVLFPAILYMIIEKRQYSYIIIFLVFSIGIIMSCTRSGILLSVIGGGITLLALRKHNTLNVIFFACIGLGALVFLLWLNPHILDNLFYRFSLLSDRNNKAFLDKINRSFFYDVYRTYIANPTILGNGFLTPYNFHNLLFTLIYQYGLLGFSMYALIVILLFRELMRSYIIHIHLRHLYFVSMACLVIVMTNELKYEFTRYESYYEVCLLFLGLLALITTLTTFSDISIETQVTPL